MYNETVMEHFRNPRNTGEMNDPDGVGEVGNPACGDVMRLFIKVENDRLTDIKFAHLPNDPPAKLDVFFN